MSAVDNMKEGWNFTSKTMGADAAVQVGTEYADYFSRVSTAIDQLSESINKKAGTTQDPSTLKGFIAEYWHAGTFNIDAAVKESASRAFVEGSNKHASVDVSTNFGETYSMKYYGSGRDSAIQQAKNVIQAYHDYLNRPRSESTIPLSFEQYIEKYGYSNDMKELLTSVYAGQGRIIPAEQLKEAIKYLENQIAKEAGKDGPNRAAVLANYKETLENLTDRICNDEGVSSTPLTKDEAEAIAALCKEGNFDPADFGYSLKELVSTEYIVGQALQAGYTAAVLTLVMQLTPELFKAIDYLIKNGEIDLEQLKTIGVKSISATTEGFLRGSISAAVTISCQAGKLGPGFVSASPHIIGAITVLALDTVKSSLMVAVGKMSAKEMGAQLTQEIIISCAALSGGAVGQMLLPQVPVLGYMLGSLLGSVVASVSIDLTKKFVVSFCVDTGFTCFGLVKQDYRLPDEVLKSMGINPIPVRRTELKRTPIARTNVRRTRAAHTKYETVELTILRRGVIGVNKVQYIP